MAEELDTSWFDINKYEKLSSLDLWGWHTQISIRNEIRRNKEAAAKWLERIKINPIIDDDDDNCDCDCEVEVEVEVEVEGEGEGEGEVEGEGEDREVEYDSRFPFNTDSVMSTSALFIWYSGTDSRLNDVWACCELQDTYTGITAKQEALITTPYDLLSKERGIDGVGLTNVNVDLTASDAQIMSDFRHWLTEYRKVAGYESCKKNFTDKNLSEWVQWRLLPYIDLTLVAAIEEKEITQATAAWLIFGSDADKVDIVDRLRRTTKPKAEWLFSDKTEAAIEVKL